MLESQLGIGWAREMGQFELHLRALYEIQFWMNDSLADPFVGIGSHLGMAGATFAAEVRY